MIVCERYRNWEVVIAVLMCLTRMQKQTESLLLLQWRSPWGRLCCPVAPMSARTGTEFGQSLCLTLQARPDRAQLYVTTFSKYDLEEYLQCNVLLFRFDTTFEESHILLWQIQVIFCLESFFENFTLFFTLGISFKTFSTSPKA